MSYTKEPLIIKPTREIPQEVMFNLKHAERDKIIPNRLWFKFPENWSQTLDKDCIIGIRNIFISQAERHVKLSWTSSVYLKSDDTKKELLEIPFNVETYVDNNDDFVKLLRYTYQWSQQKIHALQQQYSSEEPQSGSGSGIDLKTKGTIVKALKPYRMNLRYIDEVPTLILYNDMNTDQSCLYGIKIKDIKYDESDLPKLTTATPSLNKDQTIFEMKLGWDRHALYLTSSISDITNDYYLGHSERIYTPIKYYRIHSTDQKFWIDCWSTRNHSVRSVMPKDNLDELIIEALVCFDSSAMI